MAVAMETGGWRGAGSEVLDVKKKKRTAWGADAQQLMQMMMGQLHSEGPANVRVGGELSTLDLLGKADPCSTESAQLGSELQLSEFLELDPEDPLPSGWEKCLDLKTGKVYYVSQSSGVSTFNDPRKRNCSHTEMELQVTQFSPSLAAHEFLGSKRSETLRNENSLKASSSSSSGSDPQYLKCRKPKYVSSQLLSFSTGKQLWNLQLDDRHISLGANNRCELELEDQPETESNLELDLNLAAGGSSSSPSRETRHEQTVCTMEMIQNALKRTTAPPPPPPPLILKREISRLQHKPSVSSSFSSLTSTRSDPIDSNVAPSPSTSSSSSTSSRSRKPAPLHDTKQSVRGCEGDSKVDSDALVMGACTQCLMYVMLKKADPRCPRCESEVPVDFISTPGPACKRQRVNISHSR